MAATIRISILANAAKARAELNSVSKTAERQKAALGKVGDVIKTVTAGLAVGAGLLAKSAVDAASDAQQSLGATETVFGRTADQIINHSKRAAKQYGISANSYRENANLIGALFKNQGVSVGQLAGKTDDMIKKAADLSATFGGSTTDAVEALSAAFKGEFDPLERYGISIKQSTITTEAYRLAHVKTAKDFNKLSAAQQKVFNQRAAGNLINKQSISSTGAFAKETGTLAHQQQVLGAQLTDVKAKIGTAFLPALTAAAAYLSKNLPQAIVTARAALDKIVSVVSNPVFQAFAGAILAMVAAWKVYRVICTVVAAAQAILNAVLTANPIGLVILAVIGLAVAFTIAYKRSATFRAIVQVTWAAIKTVIIAVVKAVIAYFRFYYTVGSAVFRAVYNAARSAWSAIRGFVSSAIGAVTAKIDSIRSKAASVWARVKAIFSGANLFAAGAHIIQSLIDGITSRAGAAVDKVRGIAKSIRDHFPFSPAKAGPLKRHPMSRAGRNIVADLARGLADVNPVAAASNRLAGIVAASVVGLGMTAGGVLSGSVGDVALAGLRTAVAGPTVVQNFNGIVGDPVEVGRQAERAINAKRSLHGQRAL